MTHGTTQGQKTERGGTRRRERLPASNPRQVRRGLPGQRAPPRACEGARRPRGTSRQDAGAFFASRSMFAGHVSVPAPHPPTLTHTHVPRTNQTTHRRRRRPQKAVSDGDKGVLVFFSARRPAFYRPNRREVIDLSVSFKAKRIKVASFQFARS